MIRKENIIDVIFKKLTTLPDGHYIDLRTYKRNRSVIIVKRTSAHVDVIESGFFNETFHHVQTNHLKKLLKNIIRREFPRSHTIRLYTMDHYQTGIADLVKRKKI